MEIIEILSFHLNNLEKVLEVSFRTNSDNEDVIRETKIDFLEINDFGYKFHEGFDDQYLIEDDSEYYDEFEDDDLFVDENDILSFLNEYYVLFPDKLPKTDFL